MAEDLRIFITETGTPPASSTPPPVPPGGGGGSGAPPPTPPPNFPPPPPQKPGAASGTTAPPSPAKPGAASPPSSSPHSPTEGPKTVMAGFAAEIGHLTVSLARFTQDLGLLLRLHPSSIQRLRHSAPHAKEAWSKIRGGLGKFMGRFRRQKPAPAEKPAAPGDSAEEKAQKKRDEENVKRAVARGLRDRRTLGATDPDDPFHGYDSESADSGEHAYRNDENPFEGFDSYSAESKKPAKPGAAAGGPGVPAGAKIPVPGGAGGGGAAGGPATPGAGAGGAAGGGSGVMVGVGVAVAAVAVIAIIVLALKKLVDTAIELNNSFMELKDELKNVTPDLASGEASRDFERFEFQRERGARFGPGLDRLADANHRIEESLTRILDVFRSAILERLIPVVETVADVVDIAAGTVTRLEPLMNMVLSLIGQVIEHMPFMGDLKEMLDEMREVAKNTRPHVNAPGKLIEDLLKLTMDPAQRQQAPAMQQPLNGGFGGPLGAQ